MRQEFDLERNVYVDRDDAGIARQLLHTHAPVPVEARTPSLAADNYLHQFGDLLGLTSEHLEHLTARAATVVEDVPVELRFFEEKRQFDTTTVAYYQTALGLPVWQAGVAVQMKMDPPRVVVAQSTIHPDLVVKAPSKKALKTAESIDEGELARLLGLKHQSKGEYLWDAETLKIEKRGMVIYRYESAQRTHGSSPSDGESTGREAAGHFHPQHPSLPLPPVAQGIHEGQHYVCARFDFALGGRSRTQLHWVALVDVESLSVLYLEAFVSDVKGLVFEIDPITTNGGPLPSGTSAALNPVRVSDVLPGLNPPVAGTQSLVGENVQLSDVELPTIAAPTEPAGTDFNFDARTDNFAAVNAYYHCDKFFRLLDGMGFTRAGYFAATTFPSPVDHRGLEDDNPSSQTYCPIGQCINAHCLGNSGGSGILQTAFALADTGDTANPMGIACDYRVVLHELGGHGVLYNHVSSANFKFSHSAGDSIAAILNDPGSQATDRFVTFPWVNIGRRHDRTPAAGWGWEGKIALNPFNATLDGGGYNNEQILSTTHFRIYQSIGGDAAAVSTKQFAARIGAYLIVRAIGSLTPATTPANASGWATALMAADSGDWLTENVTGGCYSKVIRWSFEKQGLYQPASTPTPNNNVGSPPAIDVYIDDGRGGEYGYQPNWWTCQSVWNRLNPDGLTGHQDPAGTTNYCYVKIKNRGTSIATGVVVKGFHSKPASGVLWPTDVQPMTTAQLAAGTLQPNNAEEKIVGPFEWTPATNAFGKDVMLMIVSASGDPSNVDSFTPGRTVEDWRLVPNDNNIGRRDVALVRLSLVIADSGSFGNVCVGSFRDEMLILSNSGFNLVTISNITSSSGDFLVPSVLSYPLTIEAGNSLEIPIRFEPTGSGSKSSSITVFSNDPSSPATVTVSGVARTPRLAVVIADTGSFGNACVGSVKDEMLSLSNGGHCTLTITGITSSSGEFIVPNVLSYPLSVEAGGSIQVPIRLQPTSFGAKAANITIVSNDPAGPRSVAVSGAAPPPELDLIIANTGSFGSVCIGSVVDKPLTLLNSGLCRLTITNITSSASEFVAPGVLTYPIRIAPGTAVDVPIRFEPASFGAKSGTITITSDDPTGAKSIAVSGTVPSGKLAVTGSTCIGGVKECCLGERTIAICNVGDCKLHVTSVAFKRKSKHWKLINNPFPATLHPGSCLSVLIRYKATERCPRCCELVITSDDPALPVKTMDVMAYTIPSGCGCKKCCDDCEKGGCEKRHDDCCSAQSIDPCCGDEGDEDCDET